MRALLRQPTARMAVALALVLSVTLVTRSVMATNTERPGQWKKVRNAVSKGLPQTAIKELEPIIASAMADKAYPEAIKAIAQKITLEGTIQGNKPEERITRLKAEIAKSPKEMVPVMEAILANWYWHYFQQNRWRFMQRTTTGQQPGEDFSTWDLPRLFAEIDKHFEAALADEAKLKAIPIADFNELLEKGTVPDTYRPTLYDFLAFDALNFYESPEQAGALPSDAFDPDAGGPVLGSMDDFLAWNPQTTDTASRKLKAIKLYQKLLAFHKDDADKTALQDADLARLAFGYNAAVGEEKAARYKIALQQYAEQWAGHELSAMARYRLASVLNEENDKLEAKKIAEVAVKAFPNSPGGRLCHNLILQIEAPSVEILTERVWAEPLPAVRVKYRNITKVYFRVYKSDWVKRIGQTRWRPEQLTDDERKAFLRAKPAYEWSAELPATDDYLTRTEDTPANKALTPGFYFLFAGPDPKFTDDGKPVFATDVWVSDLALVIRNRLGGLGLDGFVLDARSGEPIAGAKVRSWVRNNNGGFADGGTVEADKNGVFTLPGQRPNGTLILASHKGRELASGNEHYSYQQTGPHPYQQTVFFTDRSLYRPGQTVRFKGICLKVNQANDDYEVIPNKALTVQFLDPNGQEISKLDVKANEFGSFAGSFTAPRDRVTGPMSLQAVGDAPGMGQLSVEEYKRPKFLVEVDAPKEPAKLGDTVTVTGKATAYTGAAVGGAQVKYRVAREVRFPGWWYDFYWWRIPPNRGTAAEIAQGTTTTEADGSFMISFLAKPDQTVPEKDDPKFTYTVTADVTDSNGETRTGTQPVTVGYTALEATVTADTWQTTGEKVKLTVTAKTLDGEGQAAKGAVTVYALKQPEKPVRPDILGRDAPIPLPRPRRGVRIAPAPEPTPDKSDPKTWEQGDAVATLPFETDAGGKTELSVELPAGPFRAVVETEDRYGKAVTAKAQITVFDPGAKNLTVKVPNLIAAPAWTVEPGNEFTALWGTGYDTGRAYVEIEHRGQVVQSYWTDESRTQARISQKVDEKMRGGFTVRVTSVRENRAYLEQKQVDVPWTNKDLTVKWERFVSKLEPGKKETFTAVVSGPDAKRAVAEMVASLYDASLDAYLPHEWMHKFGVFRQDYSYRQATFENGPHQLNHLAGWWRQNNREVPQVTYRAFPADITQNLWGYEFADGVRRMRGMMSERVMSAPEAAMAPGMAGRGALNEDVVVDSGLGMEMAKGGLGGGIAEDRAANGPPSTRGPDLSQVAARSNLNETAFFFPHLIADDQGTVRMEFTMPEALTKWKFMGFAHDKALRSGFLSGETVTAKDLMVEPNPPRFLREGDILEFTVKVTNQSAGRLNGTVRLSLTDARTGNPIDAAMGVAAPDQAFDVPSKESRTLAWRLTVPDGQGPVIYKAVGASDRLSDGEEGMLPVLSKRVFVTESLPLPIRGNQTKEFNFTKLLESRNSNTIKTQALTVQMTSNPAWYAVLALPYLMEFPHECSEQTFSRLYANALARHVANSDPKIRRVFDQWRNTPALDSPLEKNQDLKAVLLDETPWVRQAQNESQARRNVGVLFDDVRLADETARGLKKLTDMQHADGMWPWFPGGPGNDYITLYITTGFGRLRHLGVKTLDTAPAIKAVARLDDFADKMYRDVLRYAKDKKDDNHLTPTVALYLYGRSFFLTDVPVGNQHKEAVEYWKGQAKKYWLKLANRQSQAHLAVGLKRFGDKETPAAIMASIRERAVNEEEMGMYWRETELSFYWYRAPIETQAMMIEAFDEVANDPKAVEDCKVWLLKQKQTRDWKTTKATADAVYGLLLRGDNLLKSEALVEVTLGGEKVEPDAVEVGTGFYEQKFVRTEVKPDMGRIEVNKTDPGVAWGSVHWQYLEDLSKVTPHEGTPLKLEKQLFVRKYEKAGPTLHPVAGSVQVGDEVVVRVILRTDRDMEYVHLKDHRGSGTEPVNVLSRYKYQDGLGYYESTRDTSTDFFIDYLPKGTYVFEYPVRVQHRGRYPTGLANAQCMYAPEFNSHSESIMLEAR